MKEVYTSYYRYRGDTGKLTYSVTIRYILTSSAFVVFVVHTISYICDSMTRVRDKKGLVSSTYYMSFIGVRLYIKGFSFIGLWYIPHTGQHNTYSTVYSSSSSSSIR